MSKHTIFSLAILFTLLLCACAVQPSVEAPLSTPVDTAPPPSATPIITPTVTPIATPAPLCSEARLRAQIRACCEERFSAWEQNGVTDAAVWLGDIIGGPSPEIAFITFSTDGANTDTNIEFFAYAAEAYAPATAAPVFDYAQLLALNPAQVYYGYNTAAQTSADMDFLIDVYFHVQPPYKTKADAAYASFLTWYFATRSGSFLPYVALVDLDFDGVAEMALTADVGGTGGVMPLSVLTWNGAAFSEISLPPSISGESAYCDTLERYRNRKSGEEMYVAIGGVHHNNTESEEWIGFSVEDGELRGAPCWKKRTTKPAAA